MVVGPAVTLSSSINMVVIEVVGLLLASSCSCCSTLVPPFIPVSTTLRECLMVGEGMKAKLLLAL